MSRFSIDSWSAYPFGGSWAGFIQAGAVTDRPSPDKVPAVTQRLERTEPQSSWGRGRIITYSGYGNSGLVPGHGKHGFPIAVNGATMGLGADGKLFMPDRNNYSTYRIMDQQPTMKLARRMIVARILASTWSISGIDRSVPTQWVKMISDMFLPLRYRFLDQALRYMSYGWRPFHILWRMEEGNHWIDRFKALAVDKTNILINDGGSFVGLQQGQVKLYVRDYEAFKVSHDMDADNHYGISRHEAAYDAWLHWQQTRVDQLRLSNKLAGVIPLLRYPPGESFMEGMGLVDNSVLAQQILDNLTQATGVAFQAYEWDKNEIMRTPELTKVSGWSLDFYDAGNLAPAQMGMISTAEYDDKLMFRAWEVPERAGMESTSGGARADSETGSNTAVAGVEASDGDLTDQLSQGPVNMALLANFGQRAVNKVVIGASPLTERKRAAAGAFLKLLVVDPVIRAAIMKGVDVNELVDLCEVPRSDDIKIDDAVLAATSQSMGTASGSGNPTGAAVTTGARSTNVTGRTTGSIAASQKMSPEDWKFVKDEIAKLYELIQAQKDEEEPANA